MTVTISEKEKAAAIVAASEASRSGQLDAFARIVVGDREGHDVLLSVAIRATDRDEARRVLAGIVDDLDMNISTSAGGGADSFHVMSITK